MFISLLFSLFVVFAIANPIAEKRAAAPTVIIKNGTVVGSSDGMVDSFKGIPFARPPKGTLRLKPPQAITKTFGTITATGTPTSCPQQSTFVDLSSLGVLPSSVLNEILGSSFLQTAQEQGEDCLTLNVQRPSTASTSSKLPVVFWIYGGGFEFGATSSYDGSNLIKTSISLSKDIIYVAVNYRLSAFGFLGGSELQSDGSTNLGLRDQRLGLEWVAENIAAFGGDPTKVTIWGESAGSISVFDQTIINRGDNTYKGKPLFRGAMMDSGSVVPANPVNAAAPQAVYNTVVKNAGCASSSDTLACLRSVDYPTFLAASNSLPGIFSYRSLDLAYLPRPDPNDNFFPISPDQAVLSPSSKSIAKVPIIIGDQEDEGTLFSLVLGNITTTDQLVTYLASYFPDASRATVQGLVDVYPTDPSAGSPFRTGLLNNVFPQFKRIAAILGDTTFTLTRRTYLASVSGYASAWSYLASYDYGTPVLGTFHASDILAVYDGVPPEPSTSIQEYYVSFINDLDPNALGTSSPLIQWPQWTNASRQLMNFLATSNAIITDDFREAQYEYLLGHTSQLRV